jgi:methylmalonyl-CoA mutase cobalamin-binding domain/chain
VSQAEESPQPAYRSTSGVEIKAVYRPDDLAGFDPAAQLGEPGAYPFTRGVHATGYRERLWTMRQYAGFGSAEETNRRFRYLLERGQTGLSVAFDLPTQMGYDSDAVMAAGEVGRVGVPIDTVEDMELLLDGIDLGAVSASMTINATAAILLTLYQAVARRHGTDAGRLRGTIQNDILKEYIARGTYIFPPEPSMRLITDTFAYCRTELPSWNTISISGYHMREAGSTAAQEVAFTVANAIAYAEAALAAGLEFEAFAPRLSFFFAAHNDLFEEVAKFRVARRVWARVARDRFGATTRPSQAMRFHVQTGGSTLTAQQPDTNVVRTTVQALAAVLGGAQSLHTNGMDEAFAIPTEEAMKIALRTQQVLADESNVPNVIDPLGGSYYVEHLTTQMERAIFDVIAEVDSRGGTMKLIEEGWFQRRIADFAYDTAIKKAKGEKIVLGVNKLVEPGEKADIETHPYDPSTAQRQLDRLKRVRLERNQREVDRLLDRLMEVARNERENIMPVTIDLVRAGASMGEIVERLKTLWGTYRETPVF